ncbi:protein FAR1-RELATED SEQUENCE 5-like [Silene latifolia]|uniref:protein FAR1-RELATED SEQUENCE 5-like n=1 Tax=Silene latifolia TaxID=37657 RepID=UPI003D788B6C
MEGLHNIAIESLSGLEEQVAMLHEQEFRVMKMVVGAIKIRSDCHAKGMKEMEKEADDFVKSVLGTYEKCCKLREELEDDIKILKAGIPITRNFNTLVREVGGIHNLHFNGQDARNFINNERRKSRFRGDAKEVLNYFEALKAQNPDFYYAVERDADNKLLNIFWSDARCRAMYKAFGDPSSFDSTFLSNSTGCLCPFVGVNHHGSTILYAAALISYEDTESFEWVFEKWMEWMGRAPTVLLTDQCKAMEGAIKKVFPETKHRLCLWHILQNADKNLKDHPQFPRIDRDLRTLGHESITEEELQDMWDDFMEKYNLRRNKWLRGAWDMRQRWMPVFGKTLYVRYEDAIEKKMEDEKVNNAKDIKSPLKWDPMILFEDIFSKVYTNSKFEEVKTEVYGCISTNVETLPNSLGFIKRFRATSKVTEAFWKKDRRSFEVSIDTITGEYKCGCKMFEFRRILCRHIMKCLDVLDVKAIPDKYIIERRARIWLEDTKIFGLGTTTRMTQNVLKGLLR